MFSNRFWLLKAVVALLLFAALGTASQPVLESLHPRIEQVTVFREDLRDKDVIVWGRKVLTADAAGFEIDTKVGPVRVLTPHPPPVGAHVSAIARPTGTRTLRASSVQINAGWAWKRPLNYVLSILVVLGYVWSIRRLFRWRIGEGVLRGRY